MKVNSDVLGIPIEMEIKNLHIFRFLNIFSI
jgi:hypothetical protein